MKKIIQKVILFLFFLVCNFSYGQNNMEDVVYLKNGSIYRGIIIEQVPNQTIKIQMKDRNVCVVKYDEIEKFTKENIQDENIIKKSKDTKHDKIEKSIKENIHLEDENKRTKITDLKKRGYINITEINYQRDSYAYYPYNYFSFGARTVNGYQFNENFSLGIGVGLDKYNYETLLPISLDVRVTFIKGKISPVFATNMGYSFILEKKWNYYGVNNKIFINPQIGFKIYISRNIAYLFNVGFKIINTERLYVDESNRDIWKNPLYFTISTGISF